MASFCPDDGEYPFKNTPLDASAQSFLDHLNLPTLHPLCTHRNENEQKQVSFDDDNLSTIGRGVFELPKITLNRTDATQIASQLPSPPHIGSISLLELHDNSYYEILKTSTTMAAPTIAMMELWLRFFAVFMCPLCICWMVQREVKVAAGSRNKKEGNDASEDEIIMKTIFICIVGLASSAVLFTDSLYVYEYGRQFGLSLFVLSSILTIRCAILLKRNALEMRGTKATTRKSLMNKIFHFASAFLMAATLIVYLRSDGGVMIKSTTQKFFPTVHSIIYTTKSQQHHNNDSNNNIYVNPLEHMPNPGLDLPTINEGLYHSSTNAYISSIVKNWPESSRTYNIQNGATPYLVNGDQRTGIPFLVNKVEEQEHVRVWVQNPYDDEYLALDIAFPYTSTINGENEDEKQLMFSHDINKPVYLILHGLNGGSHEEYVKDFVKRRRSEGSTVVVLIARGMMDTKLVGWNAFHGARTGDVDIAARSLRKGLQSLADADMKQRQVLSGVGYSMGAIILSNYVARSGKHCALDAAMAISGGLDMRQNLSFKRSMRLWQPMLTFGLREDILIGKYARHYKHRLTKQQFLSLLRVTSISALDVEAIVTYNNFDSLIHYYSSMSAMGDRDPEFNLFGNSSDKPTSWGRIADVNIPFAVLQALDDPLVGWRTIGTNDPQGLANSGAGNILLLLTKAGGHVGWPLGNNPAKKSWKWMNDAARDFTLAVDIAKKAL